MSRSRLEKHQVHDDTVSHHLLELSNKLSGEALAMHLAASTTSLRGRPCSAECPSLRSSQGSLTPGSLCSHRSPMYGGLGKHHAYITSEPCKQCRRRWGTPANPVRPKDSDVQEASGAHWLAPRKKMLQTCFQ
ncbi:uncharacterized protein AAES06_007755 isoform 1-T1 [Glossophaga mutica]